MIVSVYTQLKVHVKFIFIFPYFDHKQDGGLLRSVFATISVSFRRFKTLVSINTKGQPYFQIRYLEVRLKAIDGQSF